MTDIENDLIETRTHYKLKGKNKKFNQKLYDKYDIPARNLLKNKLDSYVFDNPDIYAEDMILKDNQCKYKYIEIQVCANWLSDNGPYPHKTPFVYERKGHFDDNTLFIIFDKYFDKGIMFGKHALSKNPVRIKPYSRTMIYPAQWSCSLEFATEDLNIDLIRVY